MFWSCSAWAAIRQAFFKRWSKSGWPFLDTHSQLALHGLAVEDNDLLTWRKHSMIPEWTYKVAPFAPWLGDGDVMHDEDCRLVVFTDGASPV